MTRSRVLVIEDDVEFQELYRTIFASHSKEFEMVLTPSGQEALLVLEQHPRSPLDLLVLDWTLPDIQGLEILRRIKSNPATRSIPVLMVTGHISPKDAATGLGAGSDDYLKKDFGSDEFVARLRNLLRRQEDAIAEQGGYQLDGLSLDPDKTMVTLNGNALNLRAKEFSLLKIFLKRPDMIHSLAYLARALSDDGESLSPEAVRQQFRNLRQALAAWGERIETCRGEGYRLNTKLPVSQS